MTLFTLALCEGSSASRFHGSWYYHLFGFEPFWWVCDVILVFAFPKWKMVFNTFHMLIDHLHLLWIVSHFFWLIFLIDYFVFSLLVCKSSLHVMDMSPFSDMYIADISFHLWLFKLLLCDEHNYFNLDEVQFINLAVWLAPFVSCLRNLCLSVGLYSSGP